MSGQGLAAFAERDAEDIEGHAVYIDRMIQAAERYDEGLVNEMALGLGSSWQAAMKETNALVSALEELAQAARAADRRREEPRKGAAAANGAKTSGSGSSRSTASRR